MANIPSAAVDSRLSRALDAEHVAVFGASRTPGKWGYNAVERLLSGGFSGELTLVNPHGGQVLGRPLVSAEAAAGADLAVVAVPSGAVGSVIEDCGRLGIGMAVVYAGGFGETGTVDGTTLEAELLETARSSNVRLLGPNSLGMFSNSARLNVTMVPDLPGGHIAMISQSGGVAQQSAHRLVQLGSGFDFMLSLGNKLELTLNEAISLAESRATVESIYLYLERLDEGDEFLDAVAEVSQHVPVVTLLAGRTDTGRRATVSHTGSLMGNWDRVAALLSNAGSLVVDRLEEAVAAAAGATRYRERAGRRVFVLSDGGGHSVLFSDALDLAGFRLDPPSAALQTELEPLVGPVVSRLNPMDLQGAADEDPTLYLPLVQAAVESGDYDSVVVGGIFGGYEPFFDAKFGPAEQATARQIGRFVTERGFPVLFQSVYATDQSKALMILREEGVPCLEWPHEVVRALEAISTPAAPPSASADAVEVRFDPLLAERTEQVVSVFEKWSIRHELGTTMSREATRSLPDTDRWVVRLDGFPHKTAAGVIEVGVTTSELPETLDALYGRAQALGTPFIPRVAVFLPHDHEVLVTFFRDRTEGSGIVLGAGGTATEAVRDVTTGRIPENGEAVRRLLLRTRAGRSLAASDEAGCRALEELVLSLAEAFRDLPDLTELELNPIGVGDGQATVLDVLPQ